MTATALAMEAWAAVLHRYLWHGPLWCIHRSHHGGRLRAAHAAPEARWEHNDGLSLLHVPVAIGLIVYGCVGAAGLGRELCFGAGLGMTGFGLAYTLVHDGLAHGRLPVRRLLVWRYLRRVRAAHALHHRTAGPPFGLFYGMAALRAAAPQAPCKRASSPVLKRSP